MPKIPIPQQTMDPNATFQGPQNVRRASASDFSTGGEGMSAFGRSLQAVGSDTTSINAFLKEKQERDDKFTAQVQVAQDTADWTQRFDAEKTSAPLGASGFTETLLKTFDDDTQKKLDGSTLTEDAKRDYQRSRLSLRNSLAQGAVSFESQSRGTKARADTEGALTNLSQAAAADPNSFERLQSNWHATIEALPIDANQKVALKAEGEKTLRISAARGEAERNPGAVRTVLQGAMGISAGGPTNGVGEGRINHVYSGPLESSAPGKPSPKTFYAELIGKGATAKEALVLTAAAASESGFNDSVSHDGGIGYGLFGHNNERLAAMRRATGTDRPSWQQQAVFALQELRQRPEGARVNNAKTAEDLTAVQMAYERPRGYTDAAPNAGHNYTGRLNTVRRFLALDTTVGVDATSPEQAQQAAAASGGKTGNAILDSLSASERLSILGLAETAVNRAQAAERTTLDPRVQDAETAYLTTGEYTGPAITQRDFLRAYDPPQAEQRWKDLEAAREIGEQVALFKTLPAAQIEASVASAKPTRAGDGFALEQSRYEAMTKAAAEIKKQREADPVAYVLQTFPTARAAWDAASKAADADRQGTTRIAIAAMDAAYEKMAIPIAKRDLLPKQTISDAVATVNDTSQPLETRVSTVKSLLASAPDPSTQKRLFDQIVRADSKLAKTEAAFDAWFRGDSGASMRLFRASLEGGPEKLAGKLPVEESEIKQAIADQVMKTGKIGDAMYGLNGGVIGNEQKARRDIELMRDAVGYEVMSNGGDVGRAVRQATQDIYGPVQVISGRQVAATIPADRDAVQFRRGLHGVRRKFSDALNSYIPTEKPAGLSDEQFRVMEADARRYVDSVLSNGVIRNVDGGYGLINPETGQAVADKSGRKVIVSYEDIVAQGEKFDPAWEYSGAANVPY